MKKRPALGRGIDVLFGEYKEEEKTEEGRVRQLNLTDIDPNRDQPRKRFDPEKLEQLAQSIRQVGVLQPLVVAEKGGRYQIIAGERRWRAARLAGLETVPCLIREAELIERMEITLIENLQRDDLNPVETARGLQQLITECAITQEEAASRVGKSRPAVANLLRLLALPDAVLELLESGDLTEGHGRAILGLDKDKDRIALAERVRAQGLTVRQTENLVKAMKQPAQAPAKKPGHKRLPELELLEQAARRTLGVKAEAVGGAKKGRLVLHYNSAQELERLYEALGGEIE